MSILKIKGERCEFIGSEGTGHLGGDYFEKALRIKLLMKWENQKKIIILILKLGKI